MNARLHTFTECLPNPLLVPPFTGTPAFEAQEARIAEHQAAAKARLAADLLARDTRSFQHRLTYLSEVQLDALLRHWEQECDWRGDHGGNWYAYQDSAEFRAKADAAYSEACVNAALARKALDARRGVK